MISYLIIWLFVMLGSLGLSVDRFFLEVVANGVISILSSLGAGKYPPEFVLDNHLNIVNMAQPWISES